MAVVDGAMAVDTTQNISLVLINSDRKVLCIGCSCKVSCLNRLATRDSGRCERGFFMEHV